MKKNSDSRLRWLSVSGSPVAVQPCTVQSTLYLHLVDGNNRVAGVACCLHSILLSPLRLLQ